MPGWADGPSRAAIRAGPGRGSRGRRARLPPRRLPPSPSAARRCCGPTGTHGSTTGTGWATGRTRPSSPTSGRERLHRGRPGPAGPAAADPLRRDGGPHRRDRPLGAGPPRALVVLPADRGAEGLPDPLPPAGRARRRSTCPSTRRRAPASRSYWTRTSWPRGTSTSRWPTCRSAPTTPGSPSPPTPPAASLRPRVPVPRRSSTGRPGGPIGRDGRRHLLRAGLGQRQRHRLLHPRSTTPCGPSSSGATGWGPTPTPT